MSATNLILLAQKLSKVLLMQMCTENQEVLKTEIANECLLIKYCCGLLRGDDDSHSLIISREVLILTLSIFNALDVCIS